MHHAYAFCSFCSAFIFAQSRPTTTTLTWNTGKVHMHLIYLLTRTHYLVTSDFIKPPANARERSKGAIESAIYHVCPVLGFLCSFPGVPDQCVAYATVCRTVREARPGHVSMLFQVPQPQPHGMIVLEQCIHVRCNHRTGRSGRKSPGCSQPSRAALTHDSM